MKTKYKSLKVYSKPLRIFGLMSLILTLMGFGFGGEKYTCTNKNGEKEAYILVIKSNEATLKIPIIGVNKYEYCKSKENFDYYALGCVMASDNGSDYTFKFNKKLGQLIFQPNAKEWEKNIDNFYTCRRG